MPGGHQVNGKKKKGIYFSTTLPVQQSYQVEEYQKANR
jgi:hypothetical protein